MDGNTEDLQKFVPQVHFEQIPIKIYVQIKIYQRNLSIKHVQRAAANFDLYQINPVKVSRRDGINYVFNGQHTIEIVALVSGSRETPVWCMVYDDLEYQQEADVFANQQKYVKKLLPYEIFMANVEAGNDKQLIIKALVESFDLRISSNSRPGAVCCIATLEDIYNKYGYDVLQRVLRLCVITWEGEPDSLSSGILRGITRLICAFGDELKDDTFKEKVGRCSARESAAPPESAKPVLSGMPKRCCSNIIIEKRQQHALKWPLLYSRRAICWNCQNKFLWKSNSACKFLPLPTSTNLQKITHNICREKALVFSQPTMLHLICT